jgi:hypothetical protein
VTAAAGASGRALLLVDKGKSEYSITTGQDASPSEKPAAEELQRFLEEMSGARLRIVTANGPVRSK